MLSVSKNRKTQGSRRMMEDIAGEVHLEVKSEKADDMQYDSRKSRRRRSKKEMGRNDDKENAKGDNDKGKGRNEKTNEHDDETLEESSSGHSSAHLQNNQMSSNQSVNRKESLKKETNTRSKNLTKGKKGKAASKDSSNVCQTCGEEFDSRNKLHKHLGNTGHAWLKYRRVKAIGWSPIDTTRNCGLGVQLLD